MSSEQKSIKALKSETSSQSEHSETTSSEVESISEKIVREPINQAIDFRQYLRAKFEKNLDPDMKIQIDDEIFAYQRSVLELNSAYIRNLRPLRKVVKLPLESVTTDALMIIHEWMFDENAQLPRESILEVHVAAKFLQMKALIEHSWKNITAPLICEDRAFLLYLEAIYYNLPNVQSVMITRVKKFFLTMVGYAQFLKLPFGHVCELLALDDLGVNSELEVFFACVRYINSNWTERRNRIFEMLRNVRFGLLPPHVLVSFRFRKETPEINRLLEDVKVEKLLSQTMHFSIGVGTPPQACQLFKPRKWIYDIDCDYHSTKSQAGKIRLTYETFLEYTNFLAKSQTHWLDLENIEDVEKALQIYMEKTKR